MPASKKYPVPVSIITASGMIRKNWIPASSPISKIFMSKTNFYPMGENIQQQIEEAVNKNHSIVLGCRCEIWYSGRAESYLPEGDRLIIIKEDNTLIVHQPTGNNPINYMKPQTKHSIHFNNGTLFINSSNLSLKEFLDIKVSKIHFISTHKLEDGQSIQIQGTEQDMANMLFMNPEMVEKGFKPVSREEHTKFGFIDLFGYDKDNKLTVVECKRYTSDLAAVSQLRRYVEKIKDAKGIREVRGILVSQRISPNAQNMLEHWGFSWVQIKPPKYQEKFDKSQQSLLNFK